MTKIKMLTNIHRVPFFFFGLWSSHPSTFSNHVPELFLFPHPRESLFVKITYRTAIVSSTSKYHPLNSLLLKKKKKIAQREVFVPIVGPILAIVADAG
jgi:hypothetical protein